ncbi:46516_t:CDS:1 [Gigaspora margarita]|uniref:46516_t:CDS:1 n=1 Tax=Gigaspora margarita TaxID=4874 RepID=A0ABN7VYU4_GIGMA|nr:46516_t:CDS:1 [Gigaspora margarita]
MFKFNPAKYKINILKEIADFTPKDGNELLYEQNNQNIHFPIFAIDNATLKKYSFCSNYKIRTINNLSQSLDFEVINIIESSLSIHYNQFYKVPSPENLIIGLLYRGYSASDIEIKYSKFLSLRALKSKEVSDRLNQELKLKEASDRFNSTSKLNINHVILPKNKNIVLNYEAVDKIENYEDKKYTIDEKNYTIDEFLEYLLEQIKLSCKSNCLVEASFSLEYKTIYKDILELQKDIKDLEIFHLKEEFGEYFDGIHSTSGIRVY